MRIIRYYTILFFCLVGAYLISLLLIPPSASVLTKYNLSASEARALSLSVAMPLIAIWCAAFIGLRRITRYAYKIRNTKDGKGFLLMSRGLAVLVLGLPLNSLVPLILNYAAQKNPDLIELSVITSNYVSVILVAVGFYFISQGIPKLFEASSQQVPSVPTIWRTTMVVFSMLFVYLTFTNPARSVATADVERALYYLPDWLIASTIVAPYLIAWYLGLTAGYQLYKYSKNAKGIIYRRALHYISIGLIYVIGASVLIRFMSRLNAFFNEAELKLLLGIIYLLLLSISVGYIYIAIGAKKLKKIEDV